jgi:hypothetical protein
MILRTLRASFLSRGLREKIFLLLFIVLGVGVWLSSFSKRASTFWSDWRSNSVALKTQKLLLDNKSNIEAAAQKAASNLEAARTLDAPRLYAEIDRLAQEAGLKAGLGEQQDLPGGQFVVHSLRISFSKAEWEPLMKFYRSLQARSPYIGIEQFTLQVDRSNPNLYHTASIRVSSVEVMR